MFKRFSLFLTVFILMCSEGMAQESSSNPLFDSDWLYRGGVQQAEAEVRIGLGNEDLGKIPIIDLSRLNLDPKLTSGWLDITWQAPDRWSWGFNYFRSRARGDKMTDSDIEYGDLFIPANSGLTAELETQFFVLNGYYDYFQAQDKSAGIGFGIYSIDLESSVQAVIAGEPGESNETADILAPLPTVSLYYKQAFSRNWSLTADLNYFGLSIDKYDGSMVTARIAFDYWLSERWGLGAGVNFVDIDVTVDEDPFDQLYDVEYDSYFLFLSYGF